MDDLLLMDRFNALPHPLYVKTGGTWWPVHDIDVQTGCMRLDVIGKLDLSHFGSATMLRDADGIEHNPDDFYNEERAPGGDGDAS